VRGAIAEYNNERIRTVFNLQRGLSLARAHDAGLKHDVLPQTLLRRRWHDHNLGVTRPDKVTDYTRVDKAALDRRRASPQST
jgi:hypothetical protein